MYWSRLVLICWTLGICSSTSSESKGDLFLDDGVLVRSAGPVRKLGCYWQLLITINKPVRPNLRPWYNDLFTILHTSVTDSIPAVEKAMYLSKMRRLTEKNRHHDLSGFPHPPISMVFARGGSLYNGPQTVKPLLPTLPPELPSSEDNDTLTNNDTKSNDQPIFGNNFRIKRGLFNFGSKILQTLFGVGRDSDVKQLKIAVSELAKSAQSSYHNSEQLLSVYNHSRQNIQKLSDDMQRLLSTMGNLNGIIQYNQQNMNALKIRVDSLEIMRNIDNNLHKMGEILNDYSIALDIFHQSQYMLDRGYLTRLILPEKELENILLQISRKMFNVLPLNWYFRHVQISPLFSHDDNLVYQVSIPGLSQITFNNYHFNYFPIAIGNDSLRTIVGRPNVAISAMSMEYFIPNQAICFGINPMVCEIDQSFLTPSCETGLLNSRIDNCEILISKRYGMQCDVFNPLSQHHELVIAAFIPLTLNLRCANLPPKLIVINGPYKIILNPECSLHLAGKWKIDSIFTTNRTLKFQTYTALKIPKIDFTWPKDLNSEQIPLLENDFQPRTLTWPDLPKLRKPSTYNFFDTPKNTWYLTIVLVLIGIIIIVAITIICTKVGPLICIQRIIACWNIVKCCKKPIIQSTLEEKNPEPSAPIIPSSPPVPSTSQSSLADTGKTFFDNAFKTAYYKKPQSENTPVFLLQDGNPKRAGDDTKDTVYPSLIETSSV